MAGRGSRDYRADDRLRGVDWTDTLFLLRVTILAAFCIGLLMCPTLWIGPRSYPVAPVLLMLPKLEGVVAEGLYAALFALAALAVAVPKAQ